MTTARRSARDLLRERFLKMFHDDPEGAVDWLRQQVSQGSSGQGAAEVLLPYLVKASYAQRNLVFNALMDLATPHDVLSAALAIPERDGDSRVLEVAAELLEHYGAEANPVLVDLARSGKPEGRYFVGTIANMEGDEHRREALLALATHPDACTRQALLDEADRASAEDAACVCRRLALDPEQPIREAALEKLAYLES